VHDDRAPRLELGELRGGRILERGDGARDLHLLAVERFRRARRVSSQPKEPAVAGGTREIGAR
jgi:hypothetical protein